ncbi:MAG: undecaprenyldiphospho-muramoylpentapeptide beta-N-acetylglucosaminyltransferase [Candidatus Cloacimonetes bacterium]|nr:undecaprenyldiphospho-muramoylpentapeptide beta-N-acetylglucosaminyltransferase [Candidatus Cloacimonadota bacterium]
MNQKEPLKILISGGGTGGHITPAINLAKQLLQNDVRVLYIGNENSMEERIAARENIEFSAIDVQKLYRKITPAHLKFPYKLVKSIYLSSRIIKKFSPDAFIGTGGFVSGPVGFAAIMHRIPVFLQEQNSFPGLTTRLLAKFCQTIFLGQKNASTFFPLNRQIYSGNPIKSAKDSDDINSEMIGLRENSFKVLVIGGSQGSVLLNKTIEKSLDRFIEAGIEIIWQAGEKNIESIRRRTQGRKGIYLFGFTEKMHQLYKRSDVAISRAGALSIAELEENRIPALFVPLAIAAGNHQYYNAREMKEKKVAELITEKELTPNLLFEKIIMMKGKIDEYKENFTKTKHSNATEIICNHIIKFIDERRTYAGK